MEAVFLVILVFLLCTFLFKKAAGTLKLTKLNMISALYYYILFFNLLGCSIIFIGNSGHYDVQSFSTNLIFNTYYAVAYCVIIFPLFIFLTKKTCGKFKSSKSIDAFIAEKIQYNRNMRPVQTLLLFMICVCLLSTTYVFITIGRLPLVDIFKVSDMNEINILRQASGRFFTGNIYIKNILMIMLIPFLSYYTYIYYRLTLGKTWQLMFFLLALLSLIALTYDYSKAPVINYLIGIYLIDILMGRVYSGKQFRKLLLIILGIIIFFYVVMLKQGESTLFTVYFGPIGRVLFGQIIPLFFHFEVFPLRHPFLNGASFNSWLSFIIPNASGIRSGRIIMETYNPAGVEAGTAGVMNTLFIGEAYANYGIMGLLFSPIIFGIIIGLVSHFLPSLHKRPTTVLLYVELTMAYIGVLEGGFVEIFYSAHIIIIILLTIILDLIAGKGNAIIVHNTKYS